MDLNNLKSILFIYLELFTIRYYRDYDYSNIKNFRNFTIKQISKFDDYLKFKIRLYSDAVQLSTNEFTIVRCFIEYLNTVDKIIKM